MNTEIGYRNAMQRKIANISATASSMRNQAPAGAIALTIAYLETLDLNALSNAENVPDFNCWLDEHTDQLRTHTFRCLNFGGPRKVLNIFLKEIHHNRALAAYLPPSVIQQLEIPLDKHVALGINADLKKVSEQRLPKWPGIKHLTPEISRQYQKAAAEVAVVEGVSRVDLDLKYWRPKLGQD